MLDIAAPLIAHLSAGSDLDAADQLALSAVAGLNVRAGQAHSDIVVRGELVYGAMVLLDGWAIRYRLLPDGCRQILAFLLPGDIWVAPSAAARMDHSIASLTAVRYAELTQADVDGLSESSRHIRQAFRWTILQELSIQREWTVSVGQRDAQARVAHLLCELAVRTRGHGLGERDRFLFPPTQCDIGEALGLTAVHVNRMLQLLRKDGMISRNGRELIVDDFDKLAAIALFDPAYLLMDRPKV